VEREISTERGKREKKVYSPKQVARQGKETRSSRKHGEGKHESSRPTSRREEDISGREGKSKAGNC